MARGPVALTLALTITLPAAAADWPQWMGPHRDGVWAEDGVLDRFPPNGPTKLWEQPVGGGYGGPAVAGGRVFVLDYVRKSGDAAPSPVKQNELTGTERVLAFDAKTGTPGWKFEYDCPYKVSYPAGPRCTPTVDGDRVYALGTMGHLHCLDANTGKVVWKSHFPTAFGADVPLWGFSGHPLVYKNLLVCLVGGKDGALLVAFDKATGAVKWKALETPATDGPGYGPPALIEAGGRTQLVVWHSREVVGLNPDTGEKYWGEPLKPNYGMAIMAPQKGGDLLFAGGIGNVAAAFRLAADRPAASVVWRGGKTTGLYPANSTPLIADGTIYGADSMTGHLRAVDLATGNRLWETTEPTVGAADKPLPHGTAFLTRHAGSGNYFLFNETGHLVIAKLSPEGYREVGRAKLLDPTGSAFNRKVVWSHPAYADQCVFARNDETLVCYSLAAK